MRTEKKAKKENIAKKSIFVLYFCNTFTTVLCWDSQQQDSYFKESILKWHCRDDFNLKHTRADLTILKCYVFLVHLGEIYKEAREIDLQGSIFNGILNYNDDVCYTQKGNFDKHVKAESLHKWAKAKFSLSLTTTPVITNENTVALHVNQSKIFSSLGTLTQDSYEILVPTALHIPLRKSYTLALQAWMIYKGVTVWNFRKERQENVRRVNRIYHWRCQIRFKES